MIGHPNMDGTPMYATFTGLRHGCAHTRIDSHELALIIERTNKHDRSDPRGAMYLVLVRGITGYVFVMDLRVIIG